MPQSGIHAAFSFQIGQFAKTKNKLLPAIVFGAILPDVDYIAVILGFIYYPINLSENLFHRTFSLPKEVDPSKIKAIYNNGILTITLPKLKEVISKSRKLIEVK